MLVYCHDIEALVTHVLNIREYDPFNHLVRIGLDGGGGMFKIVMNVIDTTINVIGNTKKRFRNKMNAVIGCCRKYY